MYDPPSYLWAITIIGVSAIPAATSLLLYIGARRAGQGRARAALLAAAAAAVLGGWFVATAVIAQHGWYHTRLGAGTPWLPVAVTGFLGAVLALAQVPAVKRAMSAPGMNSRLEVPHIFRIAAGFAFLATMALGHLPALLAVPAGLGDIATGVATPLVARAVARGTGRRAALWLNGFGPRPDQRPGPGRPLRLRRPRHPSRHRDDRTPARPRTDRRRPPAHRPAHHQPASPHWSPANNSSGPHAADHRYPSHRPLARAPVS
jgi:hypothetical protein